MRKPDCYLIRIGEQALKSRQVQRIWMRILLENIKSGLKGKKYKIELEHNRIFVYTKDKNVEKVFSKIFGITSFSPVWVTKSNMKDIKKLSKEIARDVMKMKKDDRFAVRARRAGLHSFTSQDIGREAGSAVWSVAHSKIDLTNPEKELFVECRQKKTYIFVDRVSGPGGVPIGTAGRVVSLHSGGIDSPVAAWMMMKRGCEIVLLYADNDPYTDKTTLRRAKETAKVLKEWHIGRELKMYRFSHGKNLEEFIRKCRRDVTCVLCKRMMYRVAEAFCRKEKALAIITGESLAQVASQTLMNLRVLDSSVDVPVLRPLIGMDKLESIRIAERIGTYEKSIMKAAGCSAVPKHPLTKGKIREIVKEEEKIDVSKLAESGMKSIKAVKL